MDDNHDDTEPDDGEDADPDEGKDSGWQFRVVKKHQQSEKQNNDGHIG